MTETASDAPGRGSANAARRVTREIAAEAALWVSRLHGPDRDAPMEIEFRAWLACSPAHREAFERCTETWQAVSQIKLADAYSAVSSSRRRSLIDWSFGWRFASAGALALVLTCAALLLEQWREEGAYATAVGEQRWVVLEDGSRVLLNTDTRLRVDFTSTQRLVRIAAGEALFEVTKDARRPFVVRVAGSEVVAVGTAFDVRFVDGPKFDDVLAVTLVEGRVNVRPSPDRGADALAPRGALALQAGERLQLDRRGRANLAQVDAKLDRPNVEQVMAWKRREAVFQASSLSSAVEEMNRYSRTPIVLAGDLQGTGLRVSGVFRTGDSAGFARAVAAVHRLKLRESNGRLELENVR